MRSFSRRLVAVVGAAVVVVAAAQRAHRDRRQAAVSNLDVCEDAQSADKVSGGVP
jgi:hypothetical protein